MLPPWMHVERTLLKSIAHAQGRNRGPQQFLDGLLGLNKHLRLMYLHAYQSLVWNKAASYRISKFGTQAVIVGDLVMLDEVEEELADEEGGSEGADDGEEEEDQGADKEEEEGN
ncbi:unnamed protein product, partial [Heterosigma akashiwo]